MCLRKFELVKFMLCYLLIAKHIPKPDMGPCNRCKLAKVLNYTNIITKHPMVHGQAEIDHYIITHHHVKRNGDDGILPLARTENVSVVEALSYASKQA